MWEGYQSATYIWIHTKRVVFSSARKHGGINGKRIYSVLRTRDDWSRRDAAQVCQAQLQVHAVALYSRASDSREVNLFHKCL